MRLWLQFCQVENSTGGKSCTYLKMKGKSPHLGVRSLKATQYSKAAIKRQAPLLQWRCYDLGLPIACLLELRPTVGVPWDRNLRCNFSIQVLWAIACDVVHGGDVSAKIARSVLKHFCAWHAAVCHESSATPAHMMCLGVHSEACKWPRRAAMHNEALLCSTPVHVGCETRGLRLRSDRTHRTIAIPQIIASSRVAIWSGEKTCMVKSPHLG